MKTTDMNSFNELNIEKFSTDMLKGWVKFNQKKIDELLMDRALFLKELAKRGE